MSEQTPREYIKALRATNAAALARGEQLDFYDALAASRMTGEMAVYWLHPALVECRAHLVLINQAARLIGALDTAFEHGMYDATRDGNYGYVNRVAEVRERAAERLARRAART